MLDQASAPLPQEGTGWGTGEGLYIADASSSQSVPAVLGRTYIKFHSVGNAGQLSGCIGLAKMVKIGKQGAHTVRFLPLTAPRAMFAP